MFLYSKRLILTAFATLNVLVGSLIMQDVRAEKRLQPMKHDAIKGTMVYRHGNRVMLHISSDASSGKVTIPRFCGRLREVTAAGVVNDPTVIVHPEPDYWEVRWKGRDSAPEKVSLVFDQPPVLLSELIPVTAAGDGSIMLHAWQATTSGEKLRFEPQTHKNTVGYWVGAEDAATWSLKVDESGEFNVGILQGCGKGQGGSLVSVSLLQDGQQVSELEYEVLETGHFQNFQWRTVGKLTVAEAGVYNLRIVPKQIKQNAVMDVRAVHLVRLPAARKK